MGQRLAKTIGVLGILAAAGALTYRSGFAGKFLFDDRDSIIVNQSIRQLWPPTWLTEAPSQHSVSGRPVVAFSLALNYAIGELSLRGYHILNLAVHILCSFVLFGVVRLSLSSKRISDHIRSKASPLALVCALLWSLHPLQSECVYYIIQRTESLMALFFLLTLYASIRVHDSRWRIAWTVVAIASCVLGMGCKESMAMVPVIVFVWDYCFTEGSLKERWRARKSLYIGLAATWGVVAAIMMSGPRSMTVGTGLGVGAMQYAMNQCTVLMKYLGLLFWPHPLSIDYGEPVTVTVTEAIPGGLVVIGLLVATAVGLKRRSALGFIGAWCFVILGPTSSFIPIVTEVGADRRMYLPSAALIVLIVLTVHHVIAKLVSPPIESAEQTKTIGLRGMGSRVLVVLAAVLLGWTSHARSADYLSQVAAWQSVVRAFPENPRAHCNLATELRAAGHIDEARTHYELAVRLKPDFGDAHYFYGMMLKDINEPEAAMVQFRSAVRTNPADTTASFELGLLYTAKGQRDSAIECYQSILAANPQHLGAHLKLGYEFLIQENYADSVSHYVSALKVNPNHAIAHLNLGNALLEMGRPVDGLNSFRNALIVKPNWTPAINRIAWVLATHSDDSVREANEALQHAQRSAQLTQFQNPINLDTLAAAYANAEQFDDAVRTIEQALALFRGRETPRVRAMRQRLHRYRQNQPFRETFGAP